MLKNAGLIRMQMMLALRYEQQLFEMLLSNLNLMLSTIQFLPQAINLFWEFMFLRSFVFTV